MIDLPPPPPPLPQDDRGDWERNEPDFRGKASFDLILKRIEVSTGKLKKEVAPSNVGTDDMSNSTEVPPKENMKHAATQTPTLASPFDPSLRRVGSPKKAKKSRK